MRDRVYQVAVRHPGLNAYRVISGTDWYTVNMKARTQYEAWEQEWRRLQAEHERHRAEQARRQASEMRRRAEADARERERRRAERERRDRQIERCVSWAAQQTAEARSAVDAVVETLERALAIDDAVDWAALEDRAEFPKPRPEPPKIASPPDVPSPGEAPDGRHPRYRARIGLLGRLSSARREAREREAADRLFQDRRRWAEAVEAARAARAVNESRYRAERERAERDYTERLAAWRRERDAFVGEQRSRNETLRERRRRYEAGEPDAVVDYCHMVLARSDYPDAYPRRVDIAFRDADRTLLVDFTLPPLASVPDVKEVVYDRAAEKFGVVRFDAHEREALHDALLYQIPLRTLHELFEADRVRAIARVAFNGWLRPDDGDDACVCSIEVERATFEKVDLARVDAKECFRALGGRGWSERYALDAVAPVEAEAGDRRGDASETAPTLSVYGGQGLDEMSIDDFEHLVRELVERAFARDGESVSLARAAGGVDAIVVGPSNRSVRLVVHARRGAGAYNVETAEALASARAYERADRAVFVATGAASDQDHADANERGITLVDGSRLLGLLARSSTQTRTLARNTAEIARTTSDLDAEAV